MHNKLCPHASIYLFCFTRLVGLYLRPSELRRNASNEHKRIKYAELSEEAKEEKKRAYQRERRAGLKSQTAAANGVDAAIRASAQATVVTGKIIRHNSCSVTLWKGYGFRCSASTLINSLWLQA